MAISPFTEPAAAQSGAAPTLPKPPARPPEASALTLAATQRLRELAGQDPGFGPLTSALRHLAKWRAAVLENTLVAQSGQVVLSGPFQGMTYDVPASEGSRTARLLGVYEASLAPVIEAIIARAYPLVIDVGSAEGYYAVGLARRMPGARVLARDENPKAQVLCATLAAHNRVQVDIGGRMDHADFALCADQPTVIICDIEGAEGALLDPVAAPGLIHADILVEVHEGMQPGLLALLQARFAATHRITRLDRRLDDSALPDWAERLSDLDRLLLLWEWRATPTPWLWMERQ
ncbi:MAG: hypothetical protein V4712_01020 [Pseudomonadota bacterium]